MSKTAPMVAPPRVVRHDGDDPYLVVAADKGTATFSDIANEISLAHGFWLGDAFASGGSAGYDHKKMGITARGAWECVKRHFREMDIDIQRQPFRVVGVGDMSGDVFGNGMLLSPEIRLVAAFDHRDIFLDPDPDAAAGLAERQRLFDLPRSSWQDYDKAKISKGGGVISRASKSVALSAEISELLDIDAAALTPAELIRAILKCETDLLWFGGIGTYVRASDETDADAGDRANDALRITGTELRAKVVGEGANLGMTQRGRIEFAARGGRLNTDFIDNSAGVNTSDQEVNIKIALGPAVRAGRLTIDARNVLLTEMTDDVAANSLRNNYQQSLALSLAERRSVRDLPDYPLLMRALEARGLLDRLLEALPSDEQLLERAKAGRGLKRPELAVLLSYAKIALSQDLLDSKVPDEPLLESWLTAYFPARLHGRFATDIKKHILRREIIATGLTNAIVNRGGPVLAHADDRTRRATARPTWRSPSCRRARCSSCRSCGSASMPWTTSSAALRSSPSTRRPRSWCAPRRCGSCTMARRSATSPAPSPATARVWRRSDPPSRTCCRPGSRITSAEVEQGFLARRRAGRSCRRRRAAGSAVLRAGHHRDRRAGAASYPAGRSRVLRGWRAFPHPRSRRQGGGDRCARYLRPPGDRACRQSAGGRAGSLHARCDRRRQRAGLVDRALAGALRRTPAPGRDDAGSRSRAACRSPSHSYRWLPDSSASLRVRPFPQHQPARAIDRVLPDPQPAKACPLVGSGGSLVPDRDDAAAGNRQPGGEHLLGQQRQRGWPAPRLRCSAEAMNRSMSQVPAGRSSG